eukprot:1340104-Pyramimonas_sp.AAC.1
MFGASGQRTSTFIVYLRPPQPIWLGDGPGAQCCALAGGARGAGRWGLPAAFGQRPAMALRAMQQGVR